MSVVGAIVLVFVLLVVIGVLGIVASGVAVRSRKDRFEDQVRQSRESGCTCDYTFVEAWGGDTNVTRKADCPVHGRRGTHV
jgi:hypothetical protein